MKVGFALLRFDGEHLRLELTARQHVVDLTLDTGQGFRAGVFGFAARLFHGVHRRLHPGDAFAAVGGLVRDPAHDGQAHAEQEGIEQRMFVHNELAQGSTR